MSESEAPQASRRVAFVATYQIKVWFDADSVPAAREAVENDLQVDLPGMLDSTVAEWRFAHDEPVNVYDALFRVGVRFEVLDERQARAVSEQGPTVTFPGLLNSETTLLAVEPEG